MHARGFLTELLAFMFNRAICEGFPMTWSMSIVVRTLKSKDPSLSTNYRTIKIDHSLAKLFASILEHELSRWAVREGICAQGQVAFKRRFFTLELHSHNQLLSRRVGHTRGGYIVVLWIFARPLTLHPELG